MIDPSEAQLQTFFAADQNRPVIFVNCHRYYEKARYPEGFSEADCPTDVSGHDAYHRYLEQVEANFMPQVGGRFLLAGPVDLVLIGDGHWDEIIIGEYPSRSEAMRLPTLPGYEEIVIHRRAGLAVAQTLTLNQHDMYRLAVPDAWRERV
jgi:uncharacterized protein (DUF1330 family)